MLKGKIPGDTRVLKLVVLRLRTTMPETGNNGHRIAVQADLNGNLSFFSSKFALVPASFFSESAARALLAEVVDIDSSETVGYTKVPQYDAVLVFSNASGASLLPEIYYVLESLHGLQDYNKIVASWGYGKLYLAVAQGKTLLLCNAFDAPDFTTAEYFLFLVMKKLQLNPEVSTVYFRTPLTEEQELSLYRYFRSVEKI